MNLAAVATAIEARLAADSGGSGVHTLLSGRYYNHQAKPNDSYPYMVYNLTAEANTDAFSKDVLEVIVDFHIYSSSQSSLTVVTNILNRLYGDGTTQSDRAPTYGFHRYKPTLSGTWTADVFRRVGSFSQSDTVDAYHYVDSYAVLISR